MLQSQLTLIILVSSQISTFALPPLFLIPAGEDDPALDARLGNKGERKQFLKRHFIIDVTL
jgi:hypothetical protein